MPTTPSFIAAKTGTTLYMTPEACGTAQTALTRMKADTFMQADPFFAIRRATTINCVPITTAGLDARARRSSASTSSSRWSASMRSARCTRSRCRSIRTGARSPVVDTPDPRDPTLFPPGVPLTPTNPRQAGQQDLRQGGGPGGADQLNFHFVMRGGYNFTLHFNNSVGAMKEGRAATGRTACRPTASACSTSCGTCRTPT